MVFYMKSRLDDLNVHFCWVYLNVEAFNTCQNLSIYFYKFNTCGITTSPTQKIAEPMLIMRRYLTKRKRAAVEDPSSPWNN